MTPDNLNNLPLRGTGFYRGRFAAIARSNLKWMSIISSLELQRLAINDKNKIAISIPTHTVIYIAVVEKSYIL